MSMQPPRMTPPMEAPSRPKKRMNSTSVVIVALGVILGTGCVGGIALVVLLMPVFRRTQQSLARRRTCMTHLHQIGTSVSMYASEYDEVLPVADKWMDQLEAAGLQSADLHCPEVWFSDPQAYGYAYNSNLSKKNKSKISPSTWLVGDSTILGRNANSSKESGPIPGRHPRGGVRANNFLLIDGSSRSELSRSTLKP